ncbi:MAG: DUF4159 domain-containing protein [Fuerstiella sp.]
MYQHRTANRPQQRTAHRAIAMVFFAAVVLSASPALHAFQPVQQLSDIQLRDKVVRALGDGTDFLKRRQLANGSWSGEGQFGGKEIGVTSLALLALLNSDVPQDDPAIQKGFEFLRAQPPGLEPKLVYEASLMVMAFCATDPIRPNDKDRVIRIVDLLERTQCTSGEFGGLWGYDIIGRGRRPGSNGEDRSNGQFAVLALRDAAYAGVKIDRKVWERVHEHWLKGQRSDGSWGYHPGDGPKGSMTTAGLSTLAITTRMLQTDNDVDGTGRPDCCVPHPLPDAFEKGRAWMADAFTVFTNPPGETWHYYYLYGLERAARLGNVRFFGKHDWYREGARYFVNNQNGDGSWLAQQNSTPNVSTSFALLFLSKGLSRVVVNKLDYTSVGLKEDVRGEWNRHPLDIPNLIDYVDGLKGWPPRLTSQILSLSRLTDETAVSDMNQAPVLFISGADAPTLNDQQVRWLREYIDEGGFIFAVANCGSGTFDKGFRDLIKRMFPEGEASLQRLQSDHPVYRSEYPLPNADSIELYGVDFGCRTSIIYSPEDLACVWQKWMKHDPPNRSEGLVQRIIRANRIGTNVLAYATGREPPVKLNESGKKGERPESKINRGLTEIAQLRHSGGWDTAPKALGNLLQALNSTAGLNVAPQRRTIPITLDELKKFPIAYMHGRYRFQLSLQERDALRDYLSRGFVLFADSCCGSTKFDRSFRDLMEQIYPENPLKPIPIDHELYSDTIGHKIEKVRLRKMVPGDKSASMQTKTESVAPMLEGIEIDGRFAVIYSRYDISCALENQASLACDGYEEPDAMKLAVNIVLYAMLQDISWSRMLTEPHTKGAAK